MVHHVILWKLKEELTAEQKAEATQNIKSSLESLKGTVESIVSIKVNIANIASSNTDVMLDSVFEDKKGLELYQNHPAHQKAANTYVRPFTEQRSCLDYEE